MFLSPGQFAELFGLHSAVLFAQAGILVSLLLGTIVRWFSLRSSPRELVEKRLASLKTWWGIAILFCAALLFGRIGGVLLFALVSFLAVNEFMTLTRAELRDWRLVGLTYSLVALNYLWVFLGWRDVFVVFLPLAGLLFFAIRMVVRDQAGGFLRVASASYWGTMLTVYCLSHAPILLTLSDETNQVAGAVGWFLYLLVLVAISDISQALVGRGFGQHQIAPVLSPHKTWEGFIAGVVTTTIMAVLLARALTPLAEMPLHVGTIKVSVPFLPAALAGLLISVVGYFGDLTISGVKRDIGVKDSGTMLPGQGGILDRIDSLMFAAPVFLYYLTLILRV